MHIYSAVLQQQHNSKRFTAMIVHLYSVLCCLAQCTAQEEQILHNKVTKHKDEVVM